MSDQGNTRERTDSGEAAPPATAECWARWALRRIPHGARVLKVGGGQGHFERLALARGVDLHLLHTRCDVVERLRDEFSLGPRARVGDGRKLPWPNLTFDLVVVSDLLQHLDDVSTGAVLGEIARVLRAGGACVGSLPADTNIDAVAICPDCGRPCTQTFSAQALAEQLSRHFLPVRVRPVHCVPWERLSWKERGQAVVERAGFLFGLSDRHVQVAFEARLPLKAKASVSAVRVPELPAKLPLPLAEPHACLEQVRLPRSRRRLLVRDECRPVWS